MRISFKTWQNNWQRELAKRYDGDFNIINDLTYIKENKKSVFDSLNVEHLLQKNKCRTL